MREEHEELPRLFTAVADIWNNTKDRPGLSTRAQAIIFVVACLLIVSHRPDAVRNPQFYAEDGTIWFAQAFNFGWLHSLLLPQNGYFQTLPRLAAALGLLVPLRWAPLAMNLVGIGLQALPVTLLLSDRLSNWGTLPLRALWAMAYLVLPNVMELEATITEGQWHLALLACMVVLAQTPRNGWWKTFDILVFLIGGLTGPFCFFLLPAAIVYWFQEKQAWRLISIGLLALAAAVQIDALLRTASEARSQAPLGMTPELFLKLVVGRVYMAALWGGQSLAAQQYSAFLLIMAPIGTAVLVYAMVRANLEFRIFVLFCLVMLSLSLWHPMASSTEPQWRVLSTASGQHYWFLPMLAFVWSLLWCCLYAHLTLSTLAKLLMLTMLLGVVDDWRYLPYADMHFARYVQRFGEVQSASFQIPIYPPGWQMTLMKKTAACPVYPEGFLDAPKNGAVVSGIVPISGWVAAAGHHVKQVIVKLDAQSLLPLTPSLVRRDVDVLHPDSRDQKKGWVTYYDATRLAPGNHRVEAWATDESGCAAEIGQAEIGRAR